MALTAEQTKDILKKHATGPNDTGSAHHSRRGILVLTRLWLVLVLGAGAPSAFAGSIELNLQCRCGFVAGVGQDVLDCVPLLKRFDGATFASSRPIQYEYSSPEACQAALLSIRRFDNYLFDLPPEMERSTTYRMNLGMVRPHTETCAFSYSDGLMEWWQCRLETAMALTIPLTDTSVAGRTVIVANPGAEGGLAGDQPAWSAGLALRRIEVMTNEFSRYTPEFTLVGNPR